METDDSHSDLNLYDRSTTEEFALDSYENLLFGLSRFREVVGKWPEEVVVIGFEMKRAR